MNNPMELMKAFRSPQEFLQNAMNNSQLANNPIARNAFEMMQKGDNKGLEELARNLCNERGIEPEQALKQIKSMFGM